MLSVTRTVYGGEIQTAMYQGIPYKYEENTTLNEKLSINPGVTPPAGVYPTSKYWVIGVGGHTLTAGANGRPKTAENEYEPTNASLYEQRPFVLRLETNDLTAEQRLRYGLRRSETHGGKRYFAYYARRIDQANTTTKKYLYKTRDGVTTSVPFIPTSDNLNPVPPVLAPNQSIPTLDGSKDKIAVSSVTTIPFTEWDVQEYVNAIRIIDGDEDYAVISEIGLVAAFDATVTAEGAGGANFQFKEVMGAVIVQFVTLYTDFNSANQGTDFVIEAGVVESMTTKSN